MIIKKVIQQSFGVTRLGTEATTLTVAVFEAGDASLREMKMEALRQFPDYEEAVYLESNNRFHVFDLLRLQPVEA